MEKSLNDQNSQNNPDDLAELEGLGTVKHISPAKMAKKLAKTIRKEDPDYTYLRELFRNLRRELKIEVTPLNPLTKRTTIIPTKEEIAKYYEAVWKSRNMNHVVLIKTLLYTGMRVNEVIAVKLEDIEFEKCLIKVQKRSNKNERFVPFPHSFKEILALHVENMNKKKSKYLFQSKHKKPYTDRGIRKILEIYTKEANMEVSISPRKLRNFLFAWMKEQGINEDLIQPYSGHSSPEYLATYIKGSIQEGQEAYDKVIDKFPV